MPREIIWPRSRGKEVGALESGKLGSSRLRRRVINLRSGFEGDALSPKMKIREVR